MVIIKDREWQKVDTRGVMWDGAPIKQLSSRNLQRALAYSMMASTRMAKDLKDAMGEVDALNEVNEKLREEINENTL